MIFDIDRVYIASITAGVTVALLAAVLAWSQRGVTPTRVTLSLFFCAFAASELDTLSWILTQSMSPWAQASVDMVGFVANFCLGPLFLLYVRELTGVSQSERDRNQTWHFLLPIMAAFFYLVGVFLRSGVIFSTPSDPRDFGWVQLGFTLFSLALVVQWAVYVVWVLRLQAQHIRRLKQHFASTENLELRWIVGLAGALGIYVFQTLIGEVLTLLGMRDPVGPLLDSALVLLVVSSLALWVLRPAPDLEAAATAMNLAGTAPERKYEKSALSADQAGRIARKLRRAMEAERLYRNPNLTLSQLAQQIGVSQNYVSQTLNQTLDQSFFEFVNDWRVREAIPLVVAGQSTILAIAYEVGFNSRSSFYASFKRVTGMTPSAYKTSGARSTPLLASRVEEP
ncbi:MAG: helix-turn-helix transcriptional regulator [Pseudomonadota bacterium]